MDYFAALLDYERPYEPKWLEKEYYWYLFGKEFNDMKDDERRHLTADFDRLRPKVYQEALKGEAIRLNCKVSEVRALSPILPLGPDLHEESDLADLPPPVFLEILKKLDTLDIFRVTLVCKRWRSLIYNNPGALRRAEHARTTHIITFTDWMNPAKTPLGAKFRYQHQSFCWSLVRWFCGISENLETLILDHPTLHVSLAYLLQSCSNLKHIRIGNDGDFAEYFNGDDENNGDPFDSTSKSLFANDLNIGVVALVSTLPERVQLKKLEVFMCSAGYGDPYHPREAYRQMTKDILVSSQTLRVFSNVLITEDLIAINGRRPLTNVFSKMVVLDLHEFRPSALEVLANMDHFQLRYLRLGSYRHDVGADELTSAERSRNALHKILPKLKKLEMLTTPYDLDLTNETIELITSLELNLKRALLFQSYHPVTLVPDPPDIPIAVEPLRPDFLISFQSMLMSKNPSIDLSEIRFIVKDEETLKDLEELNTGFTFQKFPKAYWRTFEHTDLHEPKIKRHYSIDF